MSIKKPTDGDKVVKRVYLDAAKANAPKPKRRSPSSPTKSPHEASYAALLSRMYAQFNSILDDVEADTEATLQARSLALNTLAKSLPLIREAEQRAVLAPRGRDLKSLSDAELLALATADNPNPPFGTELARLAPPATLKPENEIQKTEQDSVVTAPVEEYPEDE